MPLRIFFTLSLLLLLAVTFMVVRWWRMLPQDQALLHWYPATGVALYDRRGALLAQPMKPRRILRPLEAFSPILIESLLAAEDQRFFSHLGVDLRGLSRALVQNLSGAQLQGASTITQQLAKVFVGRARRLERKSREALLALRLEQLMTKEALLERYLNHCYLGEGAYGFEAAARRYFSRSADQLSLTEAATLAALPPSPSRINPVRAPAQTLLRRDHILRQLHRIGSITAAQLSEAIIQPIGLRLGPLMPLDAVAPFAVNAALRRLRERYAEETLREKGVKVFLSIDLQHQQLAQAALQEGVQAITTRAPALSSGEGSKVRKGALVAFDWESGTPRAWVGGVDFSRRVFDHVEQGCRPIASTVKPLIAALAFDRAPQRYHLATQLSDEPMSRRLPDGTLWKPRNAGRRGRGLVSLGDALVSSLNLPFLNLTLELGLSTVAERLEALFFLPTPAALDPSLALGSSCASPSQLAEAYQLFPRLGRQAGGPLITRVLRGDGQILEDHSRPTDPEIDGPLLVDAMLRALASPPSPALISARSAWQSDYILSHVAQSGTGRRARMLPWAARVKTGTSEAGDGWLAGSAGSMTAVVWVDLDGAAPREGGGRSALPIWLDFMRAALKGEHRLDPFATQPLGISWRRAGKRLGAWSRPKLPVPAEALFSGDERGERARSFEDKIELGQDDRALEGRF
ncbi:MAG: transglycosylase domain-containing protein [Myxococcota bacterium]|nr:transglycosylase domain-containing protein [Myxococcota bacterium]